VGTTGASFLKIGVGARAVGMGEAFTAVADDASAVYWNPAGLNFLDNKEVSLMHTVWLEDIANNYLAYAQPIPGPVGGVRRALGLSVNYVTVGDIQKIDNQGNEVGGDFKPYDSAVTLSYAQRVLGVPFGCTIKYIQSKIDDQQGNAFAFDIGSMYKFNESFMCGMVVQNMGTRIQFASAHDPLPLNVKCGTAYHWNKSLLTSFDVNAPVDNRVNASAGAEYVFREIRAVQFAGRVGYKTATIEDIDALSGLSAGLGFGMDYFGIDYAWVPYGDLGNTHRVSLGVRF
jgi:long-subunit fatty acid transport protein